MLADFDRVMLVFCCCVCVRRASLALPKRIDQLLAMCGSVDGVYLALIGDGAMGKRLSERHGSWSEQGNRPTRVSGL